MTLQEILQQAKSEVDLDQRERAFRSIIEAHPDFDQGHLELARLLERTKQLEEALDITSYLLRRRPAHHPTLNLHTVLLRDLGNLDTCEKITKRWKEHHADKVQPLIRLGEIARQRHQPDLEFEYFRKAHELQPGHYWLNHRLAVLYEQRDELDQAQQYYELVRDADSEHIQTYRLGVRLSISQSDYARGLAIGALGRERHPDDWALGLAIAKCMQRAGLIHEQGSMLDRLEVRHPNEFAVLRDQGHRYRTLQHRQMAISYYKKAAIVATRPRQTRDATVEAAREYLAMGDYAQALQMSHEVLDKFPRTVSAEMVMARAQTSLHDYTSAIKTYRSILEHTPDFPGAILHLGIVYRQRHDFDASLEVLLSSKEVKATDPRISTHIAITLIQAERFDEAKEELDQLVTLFPDHAEGYVRLAHLHKRFGDQHMAIQTIENGLASCKSAESLLLGHVDILMHFGELDAAQELLSESESKISTPEWNWRMAQLLRRLGDFDSADSHIAKLPKQTKAWRIRVLHRSAEHAFQSYNYSKAHEILDQLITEEPYQPRHLLRKAVSHMLLGDIDASMAVLQKATEMINSGAQFGKVIVPLRSHIAMVINGMRSNPMAMQQLQDLLQHADHVNTDLAELLNQYPSHLGAAIYFARNLRDQDWIDQNNKRIQQKNEVSIPRIIIQYWNEARLPPGMSDITRSWKELNSGFTYLRFDERGVKRFLAHTFGKTALEAFGRCMHPAEQSDYFRLAYLAKHGGFYADADDRCRHSLEGILGDLIVAQEDLMTFGNNFIGAVAGHPAIVDAFNTATQHLSAYNNESAWFKTGPAVLTNAIARHFAKHVSLPLDDWPDIYVLSQSELAKYVTQHIPLPYKHSSKSWSHSAYRTQMTAKSASRKSDDVEQRPQEG